MKRKPNLPSVILETPVGPVSLSLDTDDPAGLAAFYAATVGFAVQPQPDGSVVLHGRDRRLVIGGGAKGTQPYSAFRLGSPAQLAALRGVGRPQELFTLDPDAEAPDAETPGC